MRAHRGSSCSPARRPCACPSPPPSASSSRRGTRGTGRARWRRAAWGSARNVHSSPNPKLLVATGRDPCLSCHVEMKTQMAAVKGKHKAVEQDCTSCHDAHASDFPMQTKQAPLQLCTSCHEHDKIKTAAMDAKF